MQKMKKTFYSNILKNHPDASWAWVELGALGGGISLNGQYFNQENCFKKALEEDPGNGKAWNNLGVLGGGDIFQQHFNQQACFQKALEVSECQNGKVWLNLGIVGGGRIHGFTQRDCFQKALELDSTMADAWHNLGVGGAGFSGGSAWGLEGVGENWIMRAKRTKKTSGWEGKQLRLVGNILEGHVLSFLGWLDIFLGVKTKHRQTKNRDPPHILSLSSFFLDDSPKHFVFPAKGNLKW